MTLSYIDCPYQSIVLALVAILSAGPTDHLVAFYFLSALLYQSEGASSLHAAISAWYVKGMSNIELKVRRSSLKLGTTALL
jgi:hypothetical protein